MRVYVRLVLLIFAVIVGCSKREKGANGEASVDPALTESLTRGENVYKQYCIACHMVDGGGAPPMNPPLTGTSFVLGDKNKLIPVILKGMSQQEIDGEKYHNVMPALDYLTDEQVADVLTYVRNNFGNKESMVNPNEVRLLRGNNPVK